MRATCVTVDGPYPYQDRYGDEHPEWAVCLTDDDGETIGKVYRVHNHTQARTLGYNMARDRRLPLSDESSPA